MRFSRKLTLASIAAIAGGGCNPNDFNTILDRAPVVAVGTGGSSTGATLGLPLRPPEGAGTTVAARMLLARIDTSYVALADYDGNGKVTVRQVSSGDLDALGGAPVVSAAARSDGTILLGAPSLGGGSPPGGGIAMLSYFPQADGSVTFQLQRGIQGGSSPGTQGDSHMGIAVAVGKIASSDAEDLVVVGDSTVRLVSGAAPTVSIASSDAVSCPNLAMARPTEPYAFRAVAVGDVLQGYLNSEIVLGGQLNGTGPGMVVFVVYDGTAILKCPKPPLTLGAVASIGTSLAIEDFNGDGFVDLAVGAPQDLVYVYFGPLDNMTSLTSPSVTIRGPLPTGFGKRVAAFRPPGQSAMPVPARLLVSDPGATVGQRAGAGKAYLFNLANAVDGTLRTDMALAGGRLLPSDPYAFFDSNPDEAGGAFGLSLGGLLFNKGVCAGGPFDPVLVPWATSGANLLTFFAYPVNENLIPRQQDPRCFAPK